MEAEFCMWSVWLVMCDMIFIECWFKWVWHEVQVVVTIQNIFEIQDNDEWSTWTSVSRSMINLGHSFLKWMLSRKIHNWNHHSYKSQMWHVIVDLCLVNWRILKPCRGDLAMVACSTAGCLCLLLPPWCHGFRLAQSTWRWRRKRIREKNMCTFLSKLNYLVLVKLLKVNQKVKLHTSGQRIQGLTGLWTGNWKQILAQLPPVPSTFLCHDAVFEVWMVVGCVSLSLLCQCWIGFVLVWCVFNLDEGFTVVTQLQGQLFFRCELELWVEWN